MSLSHYILSPEDLAMMELVDVATCENWLEGILPDRAFALTLDLLDGSVYKSVKYKYYIPPEERVKADWAARSASNHKARLPSAQDHSARPGSHGAPQDRLQLGSQGGPQAARDARPDLIPSGCLV